MASNNLSDTGKPTILLHAEAIAVERRPVAGGTVRTEMTARTRKHHVNEPPLVHPSTGRACFHWKGRCRLTALKHEGDTEILPVVEEVIVVERRPILREEVHIRRVRATDCHAETVTTREQIAQAYRMGAIRLNPKMITLQRTLPKPTGTKRMTQQTIVAVYDRRTDADAAVRDLAAASVPCQAISRHENSTGTTAETAAPREEGFWARLFGSQPDYDTSVYDRSIESGSSVVTVRVSSDQVDDISSILESHNPIDIEERSTQYETSRAATTSTMSPPSLTGSPGAVGSLGAPRTISTPATTADADTASETGAMHLAEETLAVGKRAVGGATTRVRRFVVETPVQEEVKLRDESVTLERHPVTDARPAGTADFTEKVLEMTEMSEQAVVSKTARVVEEVNLRKDVTDRVETVKDTLRRDEVEIEKVPGETTTSATTAPVMPASSSKI